MSCVVLTEVSQCLLKKRVLFSSGHCTLYQFSHTISHKSSHVICRMLWQSVVTERIISAGSQVIECVEQCAIQIEYIGVVNVHRLLLVIIVLIL